jgi:hypothetical protein
MDRAEARIAAAEYVDRLAGQAGDGLVLLEDATLERDFGWVFFYRSAREDELLAGNAPFILDRRDDRLHVTGTARPIDEYIAEYTRPPSAPLILRAVARSSHSFAVGSRRPRKALQNCRELFTGPKNKFDFPPSRSPAATCTSFPTPPDTPATPISRLAVLLLDSSMNALRHGLTGQVMTMTDEDRTAHEKFSRALIQSLAPEGAMKTQVAQRIAPTAGVATFDEAVRTYPRGVPATGGTLVGGSAPSRTISSPSDSTNTAEDFTSSTIKSMRP